MGEELVIGGMPFYFNAADADANIARRAMNIFSPYVDYTNGGVTRNVTFPEVVITPDSKRSPGARAVLERQRRRDYDLQNGIGSYNGLRLSENLAVDLARSRREVANSPYVKAANYAADAMLGVGIGTDIVAGLPIYSTLRGARELSKGNYLEGGLWLTPYLKPVAGGIKASVADAANWVNNQREIRALSKDIVQGMPFNKPWRDGSGKSNVAREFYFQNKPDQRFQLVNDMEPGNFSVHFKTDRGALTDNEKAALFERLAKEIPAGGKISTWGEITPGGIHGVNRFGSDFGWKQVDTRQLKMKGSGEPVQLGVFQKPELSKVSRLVQKTKDDFNTGRLSAQGKYSLDRLDQDVNRRLTSGENLDFESAVHDAVTDLATKKQNNRRNTAIDLGRRYENLRSVFTKNSQLGDIRTEFYNKFVDPVRRSLNDKHKTAADNYNHIFGIDLQTYYEHLKNKSLVAPDAKTKSIDWSKITYDDFLKFRKRRYYVQPLYGGGSDLDMVVNIDGKPVTVETSGYKSTFKDGPYDIVLFSENPTPEHVTGSVTASSARNETAFTLDGVQYKQLQDGRFVPANVPDEYINATASNQDYINRRYGGNLIPYGSSKLVKDQAAPHVTGDYDFYITREDLEKYVKPEVNKGRSVFVSADGASGKETRYTIVMDGEKYGKDLQSHDHPARIDFNVIDRDLLSSANGKKESRAVQLFRQLYPEEYKKEAIRLRSNPGAKMNIPFTNQELFQKAKENQDILTLLDSFEASGNNASDVGGYGAKHIGRWPELLLGTNPKSMDKAIRQYAKIQYGPDAQIPQFDISAFQDKATNLELLKKMNFPVNQEAVAESPQAMRNAFNLWYIQNAGFTRNFSYVPTDGAFGRVGRNFGPFAGTHEKSIFSGLTQFSPVTTTGGTAGGRGLDVVSDGISRPQNYFGGPSSSITIDGTGNHMINGGFQPKRNFSKYATPGDLIDTVESEISGDMPITKQQIETLNSRFGYHIPTDGSVADVKHALSEVYEPDRNGTYDPAWLAYINKEFPNLISRTAWLDRGGGYGTGTYREVVKNLPEDQMSWTWGNGSMLSSRATMDVVNKSQQPVRMPNEYKLSIFETSSPADMASFNNRNANHVYEIEYNPRYRSFLENKLTQERQKLKLEANDAAVAFRNLGDDAYEIAPSSNAGMFSNSVFNPLGVPKQLLLDWKTGTSGSSFMQQLSDYSNAEKAAMLLQPFLTIGLPTAGLYGAYRGIGNLLQQRDLSNMEWEQYNMGSKLGKAIKQTTKHKKQKK